MMMRFLVIISVFVLFSILNNHIQAQGQKQLTFNSPQLPGIYAARDVVKLSPGFSAKGNLGKERFLIDPSITPLVNYGTLSSTGIPSNQTPFSTSNAVGTIAGSADVNMIGAATYTIPITIPTGTAGMQPNINIGYSSQAGNSLLGKGWDLGGLSVISKVPKTIYFNTTSTNEPTITYGYAIDGARLISESGTYGTNGAIYGIEVENYNKIEQVGDHFIVSTKDGKTIEYGNTSDSRVNSGKGDFLWRINKVTDANGNYIQYSYGQKDGESWIQTIEYTGNANAKLAPYNKIQFLYDARSDKNVFYSEFGNVAQTKILASLSIFTNNTLFKSYEFKYAKDDLNSWLSEIIERGSDGTSLNSTKVDWGTQPATNFTHVSGLKSHSNDVASFTAGDFNGDGQTDYLAVSSSYLKYRKIHSQDHTFPVYNDASWKLIQNGTLLASGILVNGTNLQSLNAIDVDKDGKTELLYHWELNNVVTVTVYEFNNSTFAPKTGILASSYNISENLGLNTNVALGDFDGNNKIDYLIYNSTSIRKVVGCDFSATLDNWIRIFSANAIDYQNNTFPTGDVPLQVIDFDGDGKSELLFIYQWNAFVGNITADGYVKAFEVNPIVMNVGTNAFIPTVLNFTGDFNGDGLIDILQYSPNRGNPVWNMLLFNGITFEPPVVVDLPNYNANDWDTEVLISDFNVDGKSDVLILNHITNINQLFCKQYLSVDGKKFKNGTEILPKFYQGFLLKESVTMFDYNNDGKMDIVIESFVSDNSHVLSYQKSSNAILIDKITDGLNNTTTFSFTKLSNTSVYSKSKTTVGDMMFIRGGAMAVVNTISQPDGVGGLNINQYSYENLVVNTLKGGACFEKLKVKNRTTNLENSSTFTLEPFFMQTGIESSSTNSSNTKTITKTGFIYRITKDESLTKNHVNKSSSKTAISYDLAGNVAATVTDIYFMESVHDVPMSTETTTYEDFVHGKSWLPTYPQKITVKKTNINGESATFVTQMSYDFIGNLQNKISFYGLPKAVTTTYGGRNNFGIPLSVTSTALAVTAKTERIEYDRTGRFITKSFNSLNQSAKNEYNTLGFLIASIGIDGTKISNIYDGFGRLKETNMPNGFVKKINAWTNNSPTGSLYSVTTKIEGVADNVDYFDNLGRLIKSNFGTVNGKTMFKQTVYNANGTVNKTSNTYIEGSAPIWTAYITYDAFFRPSKIKIASLETTSLYSGYNGRTHTLTDPAGKTIVTEYNEQVQKISVKDKVGNITTFAYDVMGNTKIAGTNTMTYDTYGKQTSLKDPNTGTTNYDYDAFGRLISQTDAEGITFTMTYNELDQIRTKTNLTDITTYSYVASGNGIGQLENVANSATGNSQSYTYDPLGNLTKLKEVSEGQIFETQYKEYNKDGSVGQVVYPTGFTIKNVYENGYLKMVKTAENKAIWTQGTVTGIETNYTLGSYVNMQNKFDVSTNALTDIVATKGVNKLFDWTYVFEKETGNLLTRKDNIRQKTDKFQYAIGDQLKTNITADINLIEFATNGNIKSSYILNSMLTYKYDPTKINQVTKIDKTNFPQVNQQTVKYTKFSKAFEIVDGVSKYNINYGPDEERVKMTYTNSSNAALNFTRYYASNYEKEIKGSTIKETHYISGINGNVAMYVTINGANGKMYYLVHDHLGSIVQLLNEDGSVAEEQSFDAWGRRRNPDTWSYSGVTASTITARGYTGHEHLDNAGLINMNGRLYDPLICRMLSADNFIQAPDNSLSYNRYSYCLNNPLKYTDPSGQEVVVAAILIGAVIGAYIGGSMANHSYNIGNWNFSSGKTWGYMVGGAVVGGVSGGVGAGIGATGGFMANTMGVVFGSYINSVGFAALSGGKADVTFSLGVASYNFESGKLSTFSSENSVLENIGYGLGALANVSDILAGFKPGNVELRTENDPNYNSMGTGKDLISHSQLSDGNGNVLIDWGPTQQVSGFGDWVGGTNSYEKGNLISAAKMQSNPLNISGVNTTRIANYASYLNKGGQYNLAINSCVSQTSRALNMSGVFNIGIHPYILQAQMYLRSIGARPMLYSHYLYNR